MKSIIVLFSIIFSISIIFGQKSKKNKIIKKNWVVNTGAGLGAFINNHSDGISFNLNGSIVRNKHLIKFYYLTASEFLSMSAFNDTFSEIDILYGYQFDISNRWGIEPSLGIGYYKNIILGHNIHYNSNSKKYEYGKIKGLGLPIQVEISYKTKKKNWACFFMLILISQQILKV